MTDLTTDVLVVGGGPVGLTLALELGAMGVACELIDKRTQLGKLPKMERCNARTMEFYRRLGLADGIRVVGFDADLPMDVFICLEDLVHPPLVHHPYPSANELKQSALLSNDGTHPVEPYQLISQYTLEPFLLRALERSPAVTVRFGDEFVGMHERDDGVRSDIRGADGRMRRVWSRYVVGCDGGASTVRQAIGVELRGDSLTTFKQALFRCDDLFERIPIGRGRHYHIADDKGSFLIVQDDRRHFSLHATVETDAEMPALFERIAGIPISYETLYVGSWTQRLMVADRYRVGRTFLAGDSAHLVIPTGGLGMNTGAGDAVDLAWKLAAVIAGWGGPALLDSYETERRQVGLRNVAASRRAATGRREWRKLWRPTIADRTEEGRSVRAEISACADREQRWSNDLLGIELGYRYIDSPVICAQPGEGPDPASFEYVPTAWPGARLPHVWLHDGHALHDRLGRTFSLICLADPGGQERELGAAFARIGAPCVTHRVDSAAARQIYGHDYVLVRPDLHVVWRGDRLHDVDAIADTATGHRSAGTGDRAVATTPTGVQELAGEP